MRLMSDKFINQVYWDSGTTVYYQGSQISSDAKQRISFVNRLMEPGASIIEWQSAGSYQADRVVPSLPLLQVNHQYRLVVGLKTEPAQTVLIRMEFFSFQGERIKKVEFYGTSRQFVYPVGAFSYKVSLVNAGAAKVTFSRLQIADAQLDPTAFDDVWLQEAHQVTGDEQARFIFLVQDGKHSRVCNAQLGPELAPLSYQIINIAWQADGDLVATLDQQISLDPAAKVYLVSTTPATDEVVAGLCTRHSRVAGLVTDRLSGSGLNYYRWGDTPAWYSAEVVDPDWLAIGRAIKQQWKEGQDGSRSINSTTGETNSAQGQ